MDLILHGGAIYTMDRENRCVQAIAVADGIIRAVGSDEEILPLKTEHTTVIDLQGKTVVPGFNDSHMHLLSYGFSKEMAYLDPCQSMESLIQTVKDFIAEHEIPAGQWVEGRGWDQNQFPDKRLPSRLDLDLISTQHPIVLGRTCGQMCVANTMAVEQLGLLHNPPQVDKGTAETDADGTATGIFTGAAINLVYGRLPKLGVARIKKAILNACRDYVQAGLTSVQVDDFELKRAGSHEDVLEAYFQLDRDKELPLRVNLMLYLPTYQDIKEFLALGYRTGDGSPYFRIGPCKTDTDGSLGGRTAALEEPYSDDPSTTGEIYYKAEELAQMVQLAYDNHCQFMCDGIGDRALNMVIDAYAAVIEKHPEEDLRFGIDHCQITNDAIFERFKKYHLLAGLELGFVESDSYIIEDRVGPERAKSCYNWKRFIDEGIPSCAGSDNPVEPYFPIHGIYAAVTRHNWDGEPKDGWLPEQRLSVEQAVRLFTEGSAYATFEENEKGTLETGKYADMAVLSDDPFTINPDRLEDISVTATITGGKVVFGSIN